MMSICTRATAVLLLAVMFLAVPGQAQDETLQISGHDDGGDLYFTVEGRDGRNPTIVLAPGTDVSVTFTNEGPNQLHNVHFGDPIDEQTEVVDAGESRTLQFTVPSDASGSAQYWCDPHRTQGMAGDVTFSDDGEGGDGGDGDAPGNDTPAPGLLLVLAPLAAAAACRRHR